MAEKRFDVQLSDIPDPQGFDKAGALFKEAGAHKAQAAKGAGIVKAMATNEATRVGTQLFETGRAAVIGYGKAEVASDTEKALARFEGNPELVKSQAADAAATQLEGLGAPQDDPSLQAFRAEAAKYKKAKDQGLLTQDEVLTRTAAAVKKWSARLPGLQSEFRKTAANLTGISDVDVFQIHKALTTKSAQTEAAERAAKASEKYLADVAAYHGKPPALVTQADMSKYFTRQQLQNAAANKEAEAKLAAAGSTERKKAFSGIVQSVQATNVLAFSSALADLDQANKDPNRATERDKMVRGISTLLDQQRLATLATAQQKAGELGIDVSDTVKEINSNFDTYAKMLKTKEGLDSLTMLYGRADKEAAKVIDDFTIAHPTMVSAAKAGIVNPAIQLYLDNPDSAKQKFGAKMVAEFDSIFKDPISASSFGEKNTHVYGPEAYKAGGVDLRSTAFPASETERAALAKAGPVMVDSVARMLHPTEENLQGAATTTMTVVKSHDLDSVNSRAAVTKMVQSPYFARLAAKWNPEQKQKVGNGLEDKGSEGYQNSLENINEGLDKVNAGTNPAISLGWQQTLAMGRDGKLELAWQQGETGATSFLESPGGAAVGFNRTAAIVRPSETFYTGPEHSVRATMKTEIDRLNSGLDLVAAGNEVKTGTNNRRELTRAVIDSLQPGADFVPITEDHRTQVENRVKAAAPKNIEPDKLLAGIMAGERTSKGKNTGVSSKGALGTWQLTKIAVEDHLGLKAGSMKQEDFEKIATDPARAKEVASGQINKWKERFGGDVEKAFAAYNMGPTALEAVLKSDAVVKEGKEWKTLIPKETRDYIPRAMKGFGT